MLNVTKQNLIIIKFINLSIIQKEKKICYGFMPGDFQVICGSMVDENS